MSDRPKHATCVDVTNLCEEEGSSWICGPGCPPAETFGPQEGYRPVPIAPDAARDARVAARRAADARRAGAALDRLLAGPPCAGRACTCCNTLSGIEDALQHNRAYGVPLPPRWSEVVADDSAWRSCANAAYPEHGAESPCALCGYTVSHPDPLQETYPGSGLLE